MSLDESLGRREEMRSPSQENYLPMNHREGSRIYPRHDLILSKIRACEKIRISVNLREMGMRLRSVLVSLFSGCPHWVSRFFMVGPRREPEGGELSV